MSAARRTPAQRPGTLPLLAALALAAFATVAAQAVAAQTVVATHAVGKLPSALAVDPSTGSLYIANSGSSTLSIYRPAAGYVELPVQTSSALVAFTIDPISERVYVAGSDGDVSSLEPNQHLPPLTTKIGASIVSLALDHSRGLLYVVSSPDQPAGPAAGTVYVLTEASLSVVDKFPVGDGARAIVINAASGVVYVGNQGYTPPAFGGGSINMASASSNSVPGSITVYDPSSKTVTATLTGVGTPAYLAVNPFSNTVYAAGRGSDLIRIAAGSLAVTKIPFGSPFASALAVDDSSGNVFVASDYGQLASVTPGGVVSQIPVGNGSNGLLLDPVRHRVFVSNSSDNTVSVLDQLTGIVATVPVGSEPGLMALNSTNGAAFVLNRQSATVSVLGSPLTPNLSNSSTGEAPTAIGYDPVSDRSFIVNSASNTVTVHEPNGFTSSIPVGRHPVAIALNSADNRAFVVNQEDGTVSVLDTLQLRVFQTLRVGSNPSAVAADPTTGTAVVANSGDNTASVVSPNGAVRTVPVGSHPVAVVIDDTSNTAYLANSGDNTVTALDEFSLAPVSLAVGRLPSALAIDSAHGLLYVANRADNTVTALTIYPVDYGHVHTHSVIQDPTALAVDETTGLVYVTSDVDPAISVFLGTSSGSGLTINLVSASSGSFATNNTAPALAVDPLTGTAYVASSVNSTGPTINQISSILPGATAAERLNTGSVAPGPIAVSSRTGEVLTAFPSTRKFTSFLGGARGSGALALNLSSPALPGTEPALLPTQSLFLRAAVFPGTQNLPPGLHTTVFFYTGDLSSWQAVPVGLNTSFSATPELRPGQYNLFAYAGYGNLGVSRAPGDPTPRTSPITTIPFVVRFSQTTTSLAVEPGQAVTAGEHVLLTAHVNTVTGFTPSSGSVVFQDSISGTIRTLATIPITQQSGGIATVNLAGLPPGTHTLYAVYLHDSICASSVSPASVVTVGAGTPQLSLTSTLRGSAAAGYTAVLTLSNTGTGPATGLELTSLILGSTPAIASPLSLGTIAPNSEISTTVAIPGSAGADATPSVERIAGSYSGGTFGESLRVTLP